MKRIGALALFTSLIVAGCATGPTSISSAANRNPETDAAASTKDAIHPTFEAAQGWWYVRFRLAWPEGTEPAWYRDLILADRVVRPALADNRDAISLWRVHRRAARDGAGHRFSFIFRSTPATAARVYPEIRTNPTLEALQRRGVVTSVSYDDLSRIERPGIADTSDPAWSPQMRTA